MLLAINISNTRISIGGYGSGAQPLFVTHLASTADKSADQYAIDIRLLMQLYGVDSEKTDGAVISSVVPELTFRIEEAVRRLTGIGAMIVGPGVKTGLHIAIDNPAQLGAGQAACAVAATASGGVPCIIFDLGTTTTMSVIGADKKFKGAVIAAGVGTTLEMFTERTALLPHISISAPRSVIGTNSADAMRSGLIYGTAAMIEGLVKRAETEIGRARIVLTGIYSEKIASYCNIRAKLCPNLALDGLRIIYERNK